MKLSALFYSLITITLFSCGNAIPSKQVDEGKINGVIYESKELGWSIEIPKDWEITSRDKVEANEEKGKSAIEKSSGLQIDMKKLKHLISFQKNQLNIFSSTSEPVIEEYPGEYEQNYRNLLKILCQTFVDQGIKVDTASGKESIQGLEFNTFYTTVYAPNDKVILKQIMYSKLLNGYDFGVNINFTNDKDKETMLKAWRNSKFVKK